jgi:16S rRNA (uracil1498-N3)-methyltransferase
VDNNIIKIQDHDDIRHLYGPLRVRPGDKVCLSDNESFIYSTVLKNISKREAVFEVEKKERLKKELPRISLFQCILKKNAMESVIQKTTEIGVSAIVPVISRRTVSDIKGNINKIDRWQKISDEASKQSKRDFKCIIEQPVRLEDIDINFYGSFFLPYEDTTKSPSGIIDKLKDFQEVRDIAYLVGPEGGLDPEEAKILIQKNAIETNLGRNILKAETASVYFLSVIDFFIKSSR